MEQKDIKDDTDYIKETKEKWKGKGRGKGKDNRKGKIISEELEVKKSKKKNTKSVVDTKDKFLEEANKTVKMIYIDDNKRMTSNVIGRSETARLLAVRAESYCKHPVAFTDITGITKPELVAKKELLDGKFPFYLIRLISIDKEGNIICEKWDVNTMSKPEINL
jgi:hypothetical protein